MISIAEIHHKLRLELNNYLANHEVKAPADRYYNSIMGNTSFLIAGLLASHLQEDQAEWPKERWIDDCLLSEVRLTSNMLTIYGVVIWGLGNDSHWTEPFEFQIPRHHAEVDERKYTIWFGDLHNPPVIYEDFSKYRSIWDVKDREWTFRFNEASML